MTPFRLLRPLLTVLLLVATLLSATPISALELPGVEFTAPAEANAVGQPSLSADLPNQDVVRQGYDLLLDRYYQILNPADLLDGTYVGVAKALSDAGVAVKTPGPVQLGTTREQAWSDFVARMGALLKESPPPDGFNPSAVALASMAQWVNEGHTSYLTPQQYQDFVAYLRGDVRYGGIGLRPKRPGVTVAEVFPGSPAEAAGILPGDLITKVDGTSLEGQSLEQVAQLIRGPEGTPVAIEVDRPKTGEHLAFQIVRASIKVEFIDTDLVQNNIGYIRLRGFPEPSVADRFEQFLDKLPSLNARGLIIDLRGNSGGRVDIGLRLLNDFIASGPLMDQVDRSGRHRVQPATGPGWAHPIPVAILIDEGTASMGEIFAEAMRERGVARLIGKKTSGNVAAAQVFPLSDGSALQITILEIISGDGQRMNRIGVTPDEVFDASPADLEQGRDPPLEAAVTYVWRESDRAAGAPPSGQ